MEAETSLETMLHLLEERLLQPYVRRSAQAVAELLADDFLEFGSSGRMFTKPQIIDSLQWESPTRVALREVQSRTLAPGVVLVTYRAVRQGESEKQVAYSLRSSIWRWREGRWQMIFHQGTPTKEE
jgi:hypothetical protein